MSKRLAGSAADPTIQFSSLEVDGKNYKLAYSFNSIALAERACGINLLSGLGNLQDLTAAQLRGLLHAALLVAHPGTTVDQAGDFIRLDNMAIVTDAIAEAYRLSLPEKKENPTPAGAESGA